MKQKQQRLKRRAPHGSPIYSERIAAWCTKKQRRAFETRGGSGFVREAIDYWLVNHG